MFDVEGLIGVALLLLWAYCIFDVIASDAALIRNLPKTLWLVIVLLIPDVGALAWLLLGRPEKAGWRPGDTELRQQRWASPPPTNVEDSIRERDRLIAQWEQEDESKRQPPQDDERD